MLAKKGKTSSDKADSPRTYTRDFGTSPASNGLGPGSYSPDTITLILFRPIESATWGLSKISSEVSRRNCGAARSSWTEVK